MKILSVDIGGTYSRFHAYSVSAGIALSLAGPYKFETNSPTITSLDSLLQYFLKSKPASFEDPAKYDLLVLAVAGPVVGNTCNPPNISWDVDLLSLKIDVRALLINDFVAQSYSYLSPEVKGQLRLIRKGTGNSREEGIAVVGAGTGLGHCFLLRNGEDGGVRISVCKVVEQK